MARDCRFMPWRTDHTWAFHPASVPNLSLACSHRGLYRASQTVLGLHTASAGHNHGPTAPATSNQLHSIGGSRDDSDFGTQALRKLQQILWQYAASSALQPDFDEGMNAFVYQALSRRAFPDEPSCMLVNLIRFNGLTAGEAPSGITVDSQYLTRTLASVLGPFGYDPVGYNTKRGTDLLRAELPDQVHSDLHLKRFVNISLLHSVGDGGIGQFNRNSGHLRVEPHAQRPRHLQDGCETRVAVLTERLVQALPT